VTTSRREDARNASDNQRVPESENPSERRGTTVVEANNPAEPAHEPAQASAKCCDGAQPTAPMRKRTSSSRR